MPCSLFLYGAPIHDAVFCDTFSAAVNLAGCVSICLAILVALAALVILSGRFPENKRHKQMLNAAPYLIVGLVVLSPLAIPIFAFVLLVACVCMAILSVTQRKDEALDC